jgi:hypothetical protein
MKNTRIKNVLWSLIFVLFVAAICSAQSAPTALNLFFPQVVDGSQGGGVAWGTAIAVTNPAAPGTPPAHCTLFLTKDDGTAWNLTLSDENVASLGSGPTFGLLLAGGQTQYFLSPALNGDNGLPFSSGYAGVTCTDNPVTGGEIFMEGNQNGGNQNGTLAAAGVPGTLVRMRQGTTAVRDSDRQANTGVAVANPGPTATNIQFQLLDKSGANIVPPVNRTLAPRNKTAFFISDLFPGAPASVFGTLRIISDQAVAATALFFQGATFGTFPLFLVQ